MTSCQTLTFLRFHAPALAADLGLDFLPFLRTDRPRICRSEFAEKKTGHPIKDAHIKNDRFKSALSYYYSSVLLLQCVYLSQLLQKFFLTQNRNSQLLRLLQLRSSLIASNEIIGFAGNTAADFCSSALGLS